MARIRSLMRTLAALFLLGLLGTGAVLGQVTPIPPEILLVNSTVTGELSERSAFRQYIITVSEGDTYRLQMLSEDGLQPRLGLVDASGAMFLRTDQPGTGVTSDDGLVILEWTPSNSGEVGVVAGSRDQSTGSYRLTFQRIAVSDAAEPSARTVTFPCEGDEAVTLAGIRFEQVPEAGEEQPIALYIFGFEALRPVMRIQAPEAGIDLCWRLAQDATGHSAILPDGTELVLTEANREQAALLEITEQSRLGDVIITFGSVEGTSGRFLALVSGFAVNPADNQDEFLVRNGPRVAQTGPLTVGMIGVGDNNRLDPLLVLSSELGSVMTCDDAGGRGCESVPRLAGAGVTLIGSQRLIGDRFDAAVQIPPGETDWFTLTSGSFGANTSGAYALLLTGILEDAAP